MTKLLVKSECSQENNSNMERKKLQSVPGDQDGTIYRPLDISMDRNKDIIKEYTIKEVDEISLNLDSIESVQELIGQDIDIKEDQNKIFVIKQIIRVYTPDKELQRHQTCDDLVPKCQFIQNTGNDATIIYKTVQRTSEDGMTLSSSSGVSYNVERLDFNEESIERQSDIKNLDESLSRQTKKRKWLYPAIMCLCVATFVIALTTLCLLILGNQSSGSDNQSLTQSMPTTLPVVTLPINLNSRHNRHELVNISTSSATQVITTDSPIESITLPTKVQAVESFENIPAIPGRFMEKLFSNGTHTLVHFKKSGRKVLIKLPELK